MNKRQKLRLNTPDNTFNLGTDISNTDTIRDSTIILPKPIDLQEISEHFSSNIDPLDLESSFHVQEEVPLKKESNINFRAWFKNTAIWAVVLFYIFYSLKPNDYKFLIDEIEKLRTMKNDVYNIRKLENVASLSDGCYVTDTSPLYRFGFLSLNVSDKNSILEPGMSNLALQSSRGFFTIQFAKPKKVFKIALYHPEIANFNSSIKDFTVATKSKDFNFLFTGKGYEEFQLDGSEVDSLLLTIHNNHGEASYTCIYRFFVFAE